MEAQVTCAAVRLGFGQNTLVIIFSCLVFIFSMVVTFGGENKFAMLTVILLPSLNFFTDLAYILTISFPNYQVLYSLLNIIFRCVNDYVFFLFR